MNTSTVSEKTKGKRQSDIIFRKTYEDKVMETEKIVNRIRFIFFIMFFISGVSSAKSGSAPQVSNSIFINSFIFLGNAIFWEIALRKVEYKWWLKYASGTIDLLTAFGLKYGFHFHPTLGWGFALKEPATFDVLFLFVVLAGLRLDKNFSIYVGALGSLLYIAILGLAFASGEVAFTTDSSKSLEPKLVRIATEISKILFLFASSLVIAYLANDTRKFLGMLSDSESKTRFNSTVMQEVLDKTEEISIQLKEMMANLKENSLGLHSNVKEQEIFFKEDIISIDKILKDGEEINSISTAQLQMIGKIASRTEKMSAMVDSVLKEAQNTSAKAGIAKSNSDESLNYLNEVTQVVMEMKSQSEKILSISQTINDISDRTNLLSLNASIEAARAREHGRGFSVVAMEVQKLAEQSLSSSKEINHIINATVKNIEKSSLMIQETAKKLSTVSQSVEDNEDFLKTLSSAIKAQQKISFAINSDVQNISEIAENICQLTEGEKGALSKFKKRNDQKVEITESTVKSADNLNTITSSLGDISNRLLHMISQKDSIVMKENRIPLKEFSSNADEATKS